MVAIGADRTLVFLWRPARGKKYLKKKKQYQKQQRIKYGKEAFDLTLSQWNAAVNYFQTKFTEQDYSRPYLDGVPFKSISQRQREQLIVPFSDLEIKEAVWSCGGEVAMEMQSLWNDFVNF